MDAEREKLIKEFKEAERAGKEAARVLNKCRRVWEKAHRALKDYDAAHK